jgi:YHS domain-containing protein
MRHSFVSALIAIGLLSVGAGVQAGEFNNECTTALSMGKHIKTDCSIAETLKGKVYCFGNEEARQTFRKNPEATAAKAALNAMKPTGL